MSKNRGARVAVAGAKLGEDVTSCPVSQSDDSTSTPDVQIQVADGRLKGWSWVHNELVLAYGAELGPTALAVYLALAVHTNADTAQAQVSFQTLADILGLSRPTVIAAIGKLQDAGLIAVRRKRDEAGHQAASVYVLLTPGTGRARPRPKKVQSQNALPWEGRQSKIYVAPESNLRAARVKKPYHEQELKQQIEQEISPSAPTNFSDHDAMCRALADVVKIDFKLQAGRIAKTVKQLRDAGYTLTDVKNFPAWWLGDSWRAENRPVPALDDVLQFIRQAAEAAAPAVPERIDGNYSQISAEDVL